MTDHDALLRGILLNPDEDGPRLVFADFLEDDSNLGSAGLAAFIRAQVLGTQQGIAPRIRVRRNRSYRHRSSIGSFTLECPSWASWVEYRRGFLESCCLRNAPPATVFQSNPVRVITSVKYWITLTIGRDDPQGPQPWFIQIDDHSDGSTCTPYRFHGRDELVGHLSRLLRIYLDG